MMTVDLRHKNYDPDTTRSWHLSILMAPDLLAWSAHSVEDGQVMAFHSERGSALTLKGALPTGPATVSFTALPETSTLVPESAITSGNEMRFLKLVHGPVPTGLLRDEPIATLDARCIYLHDEDSELFLMGRYPQARPVPLQAVLVNSALSRSDGHASVILHHCADRLDIVVTRQRELLLSNSFHVTCSEDMLYYTLFVLEQCGIAASVAHVLFGGTHWSSSETGRLAEYFEHVAPMISPTAGTIAGLKLQEPHLWSALLEQFACAS